MNWSAKLEFNPIPLPDGKQLVTLGDVRDYFAKLPKKQTDKDPRWQEAVKALWTAVEKPNQLTLLCARVMVYRAIYGDTVPVKARKETWKEKRKAAVAARSKPRR